MSTQRTDRFFGVTGGLAVKAPCVAATNANITLSGEQTVNGIPVVTDDRVLVKDQTDATENGIYRVSTTGWIREPDFDGNRDIVQGTLVVLHDGTNTILYQVTTPNDIVIGTSDINFAVWSANDSLTDIGTTLYARSDAETSASIADYTGGSTKGTIVRPWIPWGDPMRYGASGTGASVDGSDHLAIQAALDQSIQSDDDAAPVTTDQRTFYIDTGVTWCAAGESGVHWFARGTVIETDQDIDALAVGPIALETQSSNLRIDGDLRIKYTGATLASALTGTGFLVQQVYESSFNIGVQNFKYGIQCHATDSGCVYNDFYLSIIKGNWRNVWLNPDVIQVGGGTRGPGWVNENVFHGGRFTVRDDGDAYDWHIYLYGTPGARPGGTEGRINPNNNRFINPNLEGAPSPSTIEGGYFDGGAYNCLFHPRTEMSNVQNIEILLAQGSVLSVVYGGYDTRAGYSSSLNETVRDLGQRNRVLTTDMLRINSGKSGRATTAFRATRGQRNETQERAIYEAIDAYSNSGFGQGYSSRLKRYDYDDSYHYQAATTGDIVSQDAGTDFGVHYECIAQHTAAADNEPPSQANPSGGANWRDYWEPVGFDDLGSVGIAAWDVAHGTYNAKTILFSIDGRGDIRTTRTAAATTLGSVVGRLEILDEAGASVGFLPIYDSIT